jgi:hypothetical protein
MGEVLGYELLEQEYQTRIGYKSVRDRELPQLPGRGIDVIGVELETPGADGKLRLRLLLGEVKVSDENRCPPRVVDANDDSLREQHRAHMAERGHTVSKVFQQAQRTIDSGARDLLFAAGLFLEREAWERVRVIACSVLVRSQRRCADGDCGTFYESPGDYAPATVRFLTIELPEDVETTVTKWVEKVNALETAA